MSRSLLCLPLTISYVRSHELQVVGVLLLCCLFMKKRAKKDDLRGSMYLAEGLIGAQDVIAPRVALICSRAPRPPPRQL